MPVHDGSGSNQDERLPPPGPEHSQGNPEQLVQGTQSTARSLRVQNQQLLMESQVLKDELLMGAESVEQPAEQMSERHDHVKNLTETSGIQLCAKSFILQVYDVLARHRTGPTTRSTSAGLCAPATSCPCLQGAIRNMVAGWGNGAGSWNVRSHG